MLKLDLLQKEISDTLYAKLLEFFTAEELPIAKCIDYADKIALSFSEQIAKKAVSFCEG